MVGVFETIGGTYDIYNKVSHNKEIALWIDVDGVINARVWYYDADGCIVYDRKASSSEVSKTLEAAKDELLSKRAEICAKIESLEEQLLKWTRLEEV